MKKREIRRFEMIVNERMLNEENIEEVDSKKLKEYIIESMSKNEREKKCLSKIVYVREVNYEKKKEEESNDEEQIDHVSIRIKIQEYNRKGVK